MTKRILAGLSAVVATVSAGQAPDSLVLAHVAVVDVATGRLLPDRMVTVVGDRIESIEPGTFSVGPAARVVDGRGKYLIPGLWDMHVHLSYARSSALPALVANGVTYVRDVGSRLEEIDRWRGEIATRYAVGPHIVRAGPILNGREANRYQLAITNAEDARATVRALEKTGVDVIKVHRRMPRDAFFAVMAEAKRLALPVVGHVPMTVTPTEASNAGQTTLEHAETLFEGTFSTTLGSESLAQAIAQWRTSPAAKELFDTFVKNGTIIDPTLVAGRWSLMWLEGRIDPRDHYIAASARREAAEILGPLREDAAALLAERRPLIHELETVVAQAPRGRGPRDWDRSCLRAPPRIQRARRAPSVLRHRVDARRGAPNINPAPGRAFPGARRR